HCAAPADVEHQQQPELGGLVGDKRDHKSDQADAQEGSRSLTHVSDYLDVFRPAFFFMDLRAVVVALLLLADVCLRRACFVAAARLLPLPVFRVVFAAALLAFLAGAALVPVRFAAFFFLLLAGFADVCLRDLALGGGSAVRLAGSGSMRR